MFDLGCMPEDLACQVVSLQPPFARFESRTQIAKAYVNTMNALSDYLARVIAQNQLAYEALDRLEEDLVQIVQLHV